jgi:hypothetical protein
VCAFWASRPDNKETAMAKYRGFTLTNRGGSTLISGKGRNAADGGEASSKIAARLQVNRFLKTTRLASARRGGVGADRSSSASTDNG